MEIEEGFLWGLFMAGWVFGGFGWLFFDFTGFACFISISSVSNCGGFWGLFVLSCVLFAPSGSFSFVSRAFLFGSAWFLPLSANCFPNPLCATIQLSYSCRDWAVLVSPAFLSVFLLSFLVLDNTLLNPESAVVRLSYILVSSLRFQSV